MHSDSAVLLRPVRAADLAAILEVQAACYPPAMQEASAIVLARIAHAGESSFVAMHHNGAILGYAFAYRSRLGAVTPLDAEFALAAAGDTLYLHDMAVAPRAAGQGLARRLLARLLAHAREHALDWCALVSVQGTQGFWERFGYRVAAASAEAAPALASYPAGALYMTRPAPEAAADAPNPSALS